MLLCKQPGNLVSVLHSTALVLCKLSRQHI
uniref:Uncharacterized protein n=1 Tax=Rhizophora mucronata TaxID=61149 RepID=A0A2P2NKB0_RHIMU